MNAITDGTLLTALQITGGVMCCVGGILIANTAYRSGVDASIRYSIVIIGGLFAIAGILMVVKSLGF